MSEDSISTKLREFCKNKFPTLESIPKDAEVRNNMFREHCKTEPALNQKKHLGTFYTLLEEHIKKNLGGNPDDFVKRIAQKTKQTMQLKTTVSLNPKGDKPKTEPAKNDSSVPPAPTPGATTQPLQGQGETPRPQGTMTYEQKRDMCAYPIKAMITLMRLQCPEVEELTTEQAQAIGDAYYPILSPYIESGKMMQWIFAGSVTIAILGSRVKTYRDFTAKKKELKKTETPKKEEPEKPEPEKIDEQNTTPALFKEPSKKKLSARDKDAEVKALVDKTGMDEEKVREFLQDV